MQAHAIDHLEWDKDRGWYVTTPMKMPQIRLQIGCYTRERNHRRSTSPTYHLWGKSYAYVQLLLYTRYWSASHNRWSSYTEKSETDRSRPYPSETKDLNGKRHADDNHRCSGYEIVWSLDRDLLASSSPPIHRTRYQLGEHCNTSSLSLHREAQFIPFLSSLSVC